MTPDTWHLIKKEKTKMDYFILMLLFTHAENPMSLVWIFYRNIFLLSFICLHNFLRAIDFINCRLSPFSLKIEAWESLSGLLGPIYKQTCVQNNLWTYLYKLIDELIKSIQPCNFFQNRWGRGWGMVSGFFKLLVHENMNLCNSVSVCHRANILWLTDTIAYLFGFPGEYY